MSCDDILTVLNLETNNMNLELSKSEYEHIKVTLEGAVEEFTELMHEHEYFVTALTERLVTCLEILERAE